MAAPSAKQGRTLSYSKCHYCRRDKKKCEPKDRVWPEQKCKRCSMKDLECSASVSLSQTLVSPPHALSRDDHDTRLSSVASSDRPLMVKMPSSFVENTQHSEPTPALSDGSRSSTSPGLPSMADQNAGAIVQNQTSAVDKQKLGQHGHAENDGWESVDHPVDVEAILNPFSGVDFLTNAEKGLFDNKMGPNLKRARGLSAQDQCFDGVNDGAPAKRLQSDSAIRKNFACPFLKMDPIRHRLCLRLRLDHCSRVKQHLSRAHTPTFYCQRCLNIFPDEEQYHEHLRRPNEDCVWKNDRECEFLNHEQSRLLSRKSARSLSEEEKWYQIWDLLFPTKQHPASPFIGADLSEEVQGFNEFLQNQGVEIMADMIALESPLASDQEPGMRVRELVHKGFSKIWQNWTSDWQFHKQAAGASPSVVSLVTNTSNAESRSADDIIEAKPRDIYMRQLVIIKTNDDQEYRFEEGHIDTCNDADFMLVGKHLVKKLGLKEMPLLGHDGLLQGINGPTFRPRSFVRMNFKMPWLGLDWVTVNAYVIDCNVGFNLGNRAIDKFGLLSKLHELEQTAQGWVKLRHQGTESPQSPIIPMLPMRPKAQIETSTKESRETASTASDTAAFREDWRGGRRSDFQDAQSTYAPSIESDSNSAATESTFVDMASSSHTSTWSNSATCRCDSFVLIDESEGETTSNSKVDHVKEEPQAGTEYSKLRRTDLSARLAAMVFGRFR